MSCNRALSLILFVTVFAVLVAGFKGPTVSSGLGVAVQEDYVHDEVRRMAHVVQTYVAKTGDLQPSLAKLVQADAKGHLWLEGFEGQTPSDPWNSPYELRSGDPQSHWVAVSYGPDKQADTDDDIRSDRR